MTALGSPSGPPTPELASERPRAGAMSRRPHRETGADEDGSAPTRPVPPSDE